MNKTLERKRLKMLYLRRISQFFVILILIVVPVLTMNSFDWSPSRIVLGQLPPPTVRNISGDTWVFTIGNFRFVHPIAFLDGILSAKVIYIPYLLGLGIPLLITIVFGRVFCSWLCPVGFILEMNQKFNSFLKKINFNYELSIKDIRYLLFAVMLLLSFLLSQPIISTFDPPHIFGRELMYLFAHHALSISGVGLLLSIILFESFSTSRAWCSYICPSGGGLSLLGAKRLWRISMDYKRCIICKKCDEACPYGLNPMGLAEGKVFDWTKCDNCGLCRDVCPTGAIEYKFTRRS
jgi:ferredoxin-type protein NapH